MLEINRILDAESGRLICWRCHGDVLADETVVPSRTTRYLEYPENLKIRKFLGSEAKIIMNSDRAQSDELKNFQIDRFLNLLN